METYHTFYPSPVGTLKLTASDTALVSILFSEEEKTHQKGVHPVLDETVLQLAEYFSGTRTMFELPLVQSGTPFQQKVWTLLQQVPFGKSVSYMQLAKTYGDVKAIRAVASANGKNNLPIIIPCHRVIGSNQSLVGYSGGLWRKKWLLAHEAKLYSGVQQLF